MFMESSKMCHEKYASALFLLAACPIPEGLPAFWMWGRRSVIFLTPALLIEMLSMVSSQA